MNFDRKTKDMKKYLLLFLCAFITISVNAQEKKFNYQGEVDLGYSFGLEEDFHYAKIDVINGVRFSRCFFAGAGIGLARNFSDEEFYIHDSVINSKLKTNQIGISLGFVF